MYSSWSGAVMSPIVPNIQLHLLFRLVIIRPDSRRAFIELINNASKTPSSPSKKWQK